MHQYTVLPKSWVSQRDITYISPIRNRILVTLAYEGICSVFECDCQQQVAILGVHCLQELKARLVRLHIPHVLPAIHSPREAATLQLAVGSTHLPQVCFIIHTSQSQVIRLEVQ